jgi:hypothetical protein
MNHDRYYEEAAVFLKYHAQHLGSEKELGVCDSIIKPLDRPSFSHPAGRPVFLLFILPPVLPIPIRSTTTTTLRAPTPW